MVIRHSVKELLAKNSVTQPMKYIVAIKEYQYLQYLRQRNGYYFTHKTA